MKKYLVPVYWTVSASAIVDAECSYDAGVLAEGMDLDCFDNADYSPDSFEVAFDCIEPRADDDEE